MMGVEGGFELLLRILLSPYLFLENQTFRLLAEQHLALGLSRFRICYGWCMSRSSSRLSCTAIILKQGAEKASLMWQNYTTLWRSGVSEG